MSAPPISMAVPMRAAAEPLPAKRSAAPLAVTASVASVETVIAVPIDMASTANTPPK